MSNLLLDTNGASGYGLAPGGLGYSAWTNQAGISSDGGSGLVTTGLGMLYQNIGVQEVTFSFYYRPSVLGLGENPIWTFFIAAGSPGIWLRVSQKNSGKIRFFIQSGASSTFAPDSATTIIAGSEYLLDGYARTDGSTWRMRLRLANAAGSPLETWSEITLAGQVATMMPALRTGVDSSSTATQRYRHCRVTDSAADWPIGAHTSDDAETGTPLSSYTRSWIDNPSDITNGILVGINAPWLGTYAAPYIPHYLDAEGPTKANRHINLFTIDYTPVAPPPTLYAARRLLNGTMFGDGISRVPIISGLGFDGFTTDWPAGGIASFLSGAMDSTLQAWADLFTNHLPSDPNALFLWRPGREMNSQGTIYGPNGAAITPHHGVNETPTNYRAWIQYLWDFMRPRVQNLRMAFAPQVGDGFGGLMSTAALANYYQAGAHKWATPTGYVAGPSRTVGQAFANTYAGWNEVSGSIDHIPFGVSETQVDRTDATRVADIQQYTPDFTNLLPHTKMTNFWDCVFPCQYPVIDQSGDGFVASFGTVLGNPPFLGVNTVGYTDTPAGTITLGGSLSESYTHLSSYNDSPIGAFSLSGQIGESRQTADAPVGSIVLSGTNHDGATTPARRHHSRRQRSWPVRRTS